MTRLTTLCKTQSVRRIIILSVFALALSVWPQPVLGNDSTNSAKTNRNFAVQNAVEEAKEVREATRTGLQNKIQERKEELRTIREQKREEFQQKLQQIKDTRKQKIVANLDRAYVNINKRWTTHFLNVLERLTKILDKVKARAESQNDTEALNSINDIYSQIAQVKTNVEEQAAKTYTLEITSEDKLGEAAKAVHSQLRNDLQALREQIKDIRESIRKVILTLKQPSVTNQPTP